MTARRRFKNRVRARAARTGESYTAALRHLRSAEGATMSHFSTPSQSHASLRIAVAQTTYREDPDDRAAFAAAGAEVRGLMRRAHDQGAQLIQFAEATLCFPAKRRLSTDPDQMAEADWSRFAWGALESEVSAIAAEAAHLGLWTVLGTQQRNLEGPAGERPTTGLSVIDPEGSIVARYDERILSHTKETFMYRAGGAPVVIEVGGVRLGLTSGLEVHFPELYAAYEGADVDGVLFSTAGPPDLAHAGPFAAHAVAQASMNQLWIGFSLPAGSATPAGLITPDGRWAVRCAADGPPAVAVAEIALGDPGPARVWRRSVRESHPALQFNS